MKRNITISVIVFLGLLLLVGMAWASNQGPRLRDDGPPASATVVTVQTMAVTVAITPTFSAASSSGNYFANTAGRSFFELKNTGAATYVTVTVANPTIGGGLTIANPSYYLPATSGDIRVGPWSPGYFNDSSQNVTVNYSQVTGVTIGAFELLNP